MSVKYTSYTKQFLSQHEADVRRALEICGGKAEGYAKGACPTKTGRLKNSINHKAAGSYTEVIGTSVEYAPYVEMGHHQTPGRYVPAIGKRLKASWVAGKAFLRPAVENHEGEYAAIIQSELSV